MSVAVYDLAIAPITFEIMCFVASVGAVESRPKFVILADKRRVRTQKDQEIEEWEWRRRVNQVIAASCWLLPGCRGVEIVTDQDEGRSWRQSRDALRPVPLIRGCVESHANGKNVRILRAPTEGAGAIRSAGLVGPMVVIQMRAARSQLTKNSDRAAWFAAGRYIASLGHRVVFVPDTDEVMARARYPEDLDIYSPAALDVGIRCALYEQADVVLSAGVGPSYFCALSGCRYLAFVRHAKHSVQELREPFERVWGIRWGAQLPFAGQEQRLVYQGDNFAAIRAAFDSI